MRFFNWDRYFFLRQYSCNAPLNICEIKSIPLKPLILAPASRDLCHMTGVYRDNTEQLVVSVVFNH